MDEQVKARLIADVPVKNPRNFDLENIWELKTLKEALKRKEALERETDRDADA